MCEICDWLGNDVNVDALIEKYEDALACADEWLERNIYQEILDDLRDLKRV